MRATRVLLAAVMILGIAWRAEALDVRPLIIDMIMPKPKVSHEQGWLEFSNEDRSDYYVDVRLNEQRILVHRGGRGHGGGVLVASGTTVYVVVPARRTWTLIGDSGESLVVAAYNQRSTPITFSPVGRGRDVGVRMTVHDGNKNKSAMLFGYSHRPEWDGPAPNRGGPAPAHKPAPAPAPTPGPGPGSRPGIGGPTHGQQPGIGSPSRPGSTPSAPGGGSRPNPGSPGNNKPGSNSPSPSKPGNNPGGNKPGPNNPGPGMPQNNLPPRR